MSKVGKGCALAMPLRVVAKPEAFGECRSYGRCLAVQFFKRSGGSAELNRERGFLQLIQPVAIIGQRRRPGGNAISSGDRDRGLHPGVAHQAVGALSARQVIERTDKVRQPLGQYIRSGLQPQHQAGVDGILAGGAEMDLVCRFTAGCLAQLPDQFGDDHAVRRHGMAQGQDVGLKRGADFGDARGDVLRNNPLSGLHLR